MNHMVPAVQVADAVLSTENDPHSQRSPTQFLVSMRPGKEMTMGQTVVVSLMLQQSPTTWRFLKMRVPPKKIIH